MSVLTKISRIEVAEQLQKKMLLRGPPRGDLPQVQVAGECPVLNDQKRNSAGGSQPPFTVTTLRQPQTTSKRDYAFLKKTVSSCVNSKHLLQLPLSFDIIICINQMSKYSLLTFSKHCSLCRSGFKKPHGRPPTRLGCRCLF